MRHFLFALLLAPTLVAAQNEFPNAILETGGVEYGAQATQLFGAQFEDGAPFGPYEFVQAIDAENDGQFESGTAFDGCSPFENADEVAGKIAIISRGACLFIDKAENAANAGAVAYVVYMDNRETSKGPLLTMGGNCEPSVCSVPGVFVSRTTYLWSLADPKFGQEITITASFSGSPTATEEETTAGTYRLASIYPNPVATTAQVGFTLPTAEEARVEVFDLLGRRVATLTDGLRAAGEHRVTLDAASLPSGVYVVRLSTPGARLTERITVVR
ncbi:MAG: PA domain-containing protein [Bacteroidota bacterium]